MVLTRLGLALDEALRHGHFASPARLDMARLDLPPQPHAKKCRLVCSGPLSQRIACGRPRCPITYMSHDGWQELCPLSSQDTLR